MKKEEEIERIESFNKFSDLVELLVQAFIAARSRPNIDEFDLGSDYDDQFIYNLTILIEDLIRDFNHDWNADVLCQEFKDISNAIRKLWQTGNMVEIPKLSNRFQAVINIMEATRIPRDIFHHGVTTVLPEDEEVKFSEAQSISNYVMCLIGTLGRALPPPSNKLVVDATLETFDLYRQERVIPSFVVIKTLEKWTRQYFHKMEVVREEIGYSLSGSLERTRDQGGILSLCTDFYKSHINLTFQELRALGFKNVSRWKETLYSSEIIHPENFSESIDIDKLYIFALAKDLLKPYLDHALVCARDSCPSIDEHLPLVPIGIPERGFKTRCISLGTGLLNILGDPIREAMFSILKHDKRLSFRMKGEKEETLRYFFEDFEKYDIFHSSDLRRSTDLMSFRFAETLFRTLHKMGKLTTEQLSIALLSSGPFRMCHPITRPDFTEEDVTYEDVRKNLTWYTSSSTNPSIKEMIDRYYKHYADIYDKQNASFIYDIMHPETGIDPTLSESRPGLGYKNPDEIENAKDVEDSLQTFRRSFLEPHVFHFKIAAVLKESWFSKVRGSGHDPRNYMTKCGSQLGNSISIAILNSYNVFSDDYAKSQPGARGRSLLCGDDALRIGSYEYIESYKDMIKAFGAEFSPTKDVETNLKKGVFTEYYFFKNKILTVPKLKSIVRLPDNQPSAWLRDLAAARSIYSPNKEVTKELQRIILQRHSETFYKVARDIPLGLPEKLGGFPDFFKLNARSLELYNQLKSVKSDYKRFFYTKRFLSPLQLVSVTENDQLSISIKSLLDRYEEPEFHLNQEWDPEKFIWFSVFIKRLTAASQSVTALHEKKIGNYVPEINPDGLILSTHVEYDNLREKMELEEYLQEPLSDEEFIARTFYADVPLAWTQQILPS